MSTSSPPIEHPKATLVLVGVDLAACEPLAEHRRGVWRAGVATLPTTGDRAR